MQFFRHCCLVSRNALDHKSVTSYLEEKIDGFQSYLSSLNHLDKSYLNEVSRDAFQGKGKFFRRRLVSLVSMCCNSMTINSKKFSLQPNQLKLAYITEMIHVASLIHDDVVDNSSVRRNCPSLRAYYGESTAVFAGSFVMAQEALVEVASLKNTVDTKLLTQVTEDLVSGELMQLGVKKTSEQRLTHYLDKSYRKTASLMAQSC